MICTEELFASRNNTLHKDCSPDCSGRKRVRRIPLRRSYCWLRGCCPGRDDNCIFQYNVRNATCYCDEFCTSEPPDSIDCCPDFWLACHKHTPEHVRPQVQQWGKCYVPTSISTRQRSWCPSGMWPAECCKKVRTLRDEPWNSLPSEVGSAPSLEDFIYLFQKMYIATHLPKATQGGLHDYKNII